jgi:glucuronokinase
VCLSDLAAEAIVSEAGDEEGGDAAPLVRAALARFARLAPQIDVRVGVEVRTTIPRQVGLAGSSAIVLSVLRAVADLTGTPVEQDVLAREALAAEVDELGIAAGPQDRIVQTLGGLVAMDFSAHRYEPLDPRLLPPLFIAYRTGGGEASGVVHGGLRARWEADDPVVAEGMRELAVLARDARDALVRGDHADFAACVDGSFDARARMVDLDPADARLVALARAHGAAANYAGSGGAVVGIFTPATDARALADAYVAAGAAFRRASVHIPRRDGRRLDHG